VRTRAAESVPDYELQAVRVQQGIVSLLFTARRGPGAFAVALYASGTKLSTSVKGTQLASGELERASQPIATWWQNAELQQTLAACGAALPSGAATTVGNSLPLAAENLLDSRSPTSGMGHRPGWIIVGESLFVLLIGGVVIGLWRVRTQLFTRDTWMPAFLTLLALVFRFLAHAGPSDIRYVIQESETRRAGWAALLSLVFDVLPREDETVWMINRIVGALSVPLLYAIMRRRFADPVAAVGAAATLAVTPLIARFSASDAPYVLLCAALLGAVLAYDRYAESGSTAMVLALGLLTTAMQLRPEAPWLVVPAVLLALSGNPLPSLRELLRPSFVLCALSFLAINGIAAAWAMVGNEHQLAGFVLAGSAFGSPWTYAEMTPRLLCALVVIGGVSAALWQYGLAGLLWVVATIVALPLDYPVHVWPGVAFGSHAGEQVPQFANARYHLPAMYLACGLAGLGVALLLHLLHRVTTRRLPAAEIVAIALVWLAAAPRFDLLDRMWTPQREFEFFREGLTHVDADCQVIAMKGSVDAGFVPFDYLVPGRLLDVDEFLHSAPSRDCSVFYRGGNCYAVDLAPESDRATFDMNSSCRAMEERFHLEPIVETQVPALAYRSEVYARSPLPLGFYRVREIPPLRTSP
jgi:hypothetical protein